MHLNDEDHTHSRNLLLTAPHLQVWHICYLEALSSTNHPQLLCCNNLVRAFSWAVQGSRAARLPAPTWDTFKTEGSTESVLNGPKMQPWHCTAKATGSSAAHTSSSRQSLWLFSLWISCSVWIFVVCKETCSALLKQRPLLHVFLI